MPSVIESVQNYTEAGTTVQPCRTYVGQQSGVSRKLKINEAPVRVNRTQLNLDSVADFNPPIGHNPVIGLALIPPFSLLSPKGIMFTTAEAYEFNLYAGSSLVFNKVFDVTDVGVQLDDESAVALHPQDPTRILYVGGAFGPLLYTYKRSPPAQTNVGLVGANFVQNALSNYGLLTAFATIDGQPLGQSPLDAGKGITVALSRAAWQQMIPATFAFSPSTV